MSARLPILGAQSAPSAPPAATPGAGARPAHRLRADPFPLLFGLGFLFGWLGVSHWIVYALGWSAGYSGTTHANLQMMCFELAFAGGFLLTALPKRTRTAPASWLELGLLVAGLLWAAALSLAERPAGAALGYVLALGALGAFVVRRLWRPGRPPPASFFLVPLALLQGLVGGVLSTQPLPPWLVGLAGDLTRQGVYFTLVLGIGGLILRLVFGHGPPRDYDRAERPRALVLLALGLGMTLTLVLEHALGLGLLLAVRGALLAAGLCLAAGLHRWPAAPGWQRRAAWLAAWMLPLGAVLGGLLPGYRVAALHLSFVGGLSLLSLVVAAHVALGHTGREERRDRARAPVAIYAGLVLLAAFTRGSADLLLDSYFNHLAYAAGAWLLGSLVWLYLVLPRAPARV